MKSFRSFILPAALLLGACAWVATHRMPNRNVATLSADLAISRQQEFESQQPEEKVLASATSLPPTPKPRQVMPKIRLPSEKNATSNSPRARTIFNPFALAEENSASDASLDTSSIADEPAQDAEPIQFQPLLEVERQNKTPSAGIIEAERTPEQQTVAWETVVVPAAETPPNLKYPSNAASWIASEQLLSNAPSATPMVVEPSPSSPQSTIPAKIEQPRASETDQQKPLDPISNDDQDLWQRFKPTRTFQGFEVSPEIDDFSSALPDCETFDPQSEIDIYQGKKLNATQRPLLELGRPWYQLGQLAPCQTFWGNHNPLTPQFIVFGDSRAAVASNRQPGDSQSLLAMQSNLFFDWKFTGTERIHFNLTPSTQGPNNSRWLLDEDRFVSEFNADINFGFFEGDLGAMAGGITNRTLPFDLPIAIGVIPLVMQNGIWLDDAFLGAAATIPARNSAWLDISNFDVTFFAGWDKLNSPAFGLDDNAAKVYGVASWIEAWNGYVEADYAFVEDRDSLLDRSYHNIGLAYSRRLGHFLSNSTRIIINAGQSSSGIPNTADGVLFLSENSLITANPSTILPYFNLFAGFDRPQSVGRAGVAGGVLRNTGILFESDNLTGYPTLDSSANQTYGMAAGLSLMPQNFNQQLILEAACLGVMGDDLGRLAAGDQRGMGFRYQLPLNNSVIFRVDGMYGFFADSDDVSGLRMELRKKF